MKYNLEIYATDASPHEATLDDVRAELPRKGELYRLTNAPQQQKHLIGFYDVIEVIHSGELYEGQHRPCIMLEIPTVIIGNKRDRI